jgi:hypothetical protein
MARFCKSSNALLHQQSGIHRKDKEREAISIAEQLEHENLSLQARIHF